jgi:hypothetical protein
LGVATAVFREIWDRRIREASELQHLIGRPLFATIPAIKPASQGGARSRIAIGRERSAAI